MGEKEAGHGSGTPHEPLPLLPPPQLPSRFVVSAALPTVSWSLLGPLRRGPGRPLRTNRTTMENCENEPAFGNTPGVACAASSG